MSKECPSLIDFTLVDRLLSAFRSNCEQPVSTMTDSHVVNVDKGCYSSRCPYHRIVHSPHIHSVTVSLTAKRWRVSYDRLDSTGESWVRQAHTIKSPEGWVWKTGTMGRVWLSKIGAADERNVPLDIIYRSQFREGVIEEFLIGN